MTAEEFGVKDMLLLLNNKLDQVLKQMSTKADVSEVLKLRERMHNVEGSAGAALGGGDHPYQGRRRDKGRDERGRWNHLRSSEFTDNRRSCGSRSGGAQNESSPDYQLGCGFVGKYRNGEHPSYLGRQDPLRGGRQCEWIGLVSL